MSDQQSANQSATGYGIAQASGPGASASVNITQLPLPPAPGSAPPWPALIIGRDHDIRNLKLRLGIAETGGATAPVKVLTVVRGWPGVGKTTLAAALAHDREINAQLSDGVLWVSLGQHPNLFEELAAWGRALGVPQLNARTIEEASAQLTALLRNKRMLLIVDDVWQAEHAIPFRVGGSGCALLITTRLPEVARKIAPSARDVYVLEVLTVENALELLRVLAPQVMADNPEVIQELVQDLDGLPLAIQVAGRLLNSEADLGFGITDLLQDIREGAKLIAAQAPADRAEVANETTPSVAALLKKSSDLLNAHDLDCFAYLGVFAPKPATFDAEAMQAVWQVEDPKPTILTLVNHGLLEPTGNGRFWIHAIMVTHAKSFLTKTGMPSLRKAELRHVLYYANQLKAFQSAYEAGDRDGAVMRFERDWDQIRRGQTWSADREASDEDAASLTAAYHSFGYRLLNLRRTPSEMIRWTDPALRYLSRLGDEDRFAEVLNTRGGAAYSNGDYKQAVEYFKRALEIARKRARTIGDDYTNQQYGGYLRNLGAVYQRIGQFEQAIATYQEALEIAERRGDRQEESALLGNLGVAYAEHDEDNLAIPLYLRALNVAEESGALDLQAHWSGNLGNSYVNVGRTQEGIQQLERALAISRSLEDRSGEGLRLGNLADAYLKLQQPDRALPARQQQLEIAREFGDTFGQASGLNGLGRVHDALGNTESALHCFELAADQFTALGLPHLEAESRANIRVMRSREIDALVNRGNEELAKECWAGALEAYEAGLQISRDIGHRSWESLCLGNLGWTRHLMGNSELAIDLLNQALTIDQGLENRALYGRHLGNLANIYHMLEDVERAKELYEAALVQLEGVDDQQELKAMTLANLAIIAQSQERLHEAQPLGRSASPSRRRSTKMDQRTIDDFGLFLINQQLTQSIAEVTAIDGDGTVVAGIPAGNIEIGKGGTSVTLLLHTGVIHRLDFSAISTITVRLKDGTVQAFGG